MRQARPARPPTGESVPNPHSPTLLRAGGGINLGPRFTEVADHAGILSAVTAIHGRDVSLADYQLLEIPAGPAKGTQLPRGCIHNSLVNCTVAIVALDPLKLFGVPDAETNRSIRPGDCILYNSYTPAYEALFGAPYLECSPAVAPRNHAARALALTYAPTPALLEAGGSVIAPALHTLQKARPSVVQLLRGASSVINLPTTYEEAVLPSDDVRVITRAETPFEVEYVNRGWEELCGWRLEEVRGKTLGIIQGPETSKSALRCLGDALEGGYPTAVTLVNYTRDNRRFLNTLVVQPLRDAATGVITHFLGVIQEKSAADNRLGRESLGAQGPGGAWADGRNPPWRVGVGDEELARRLGLV